MTNLASALPAPALRDLPVRRAAGLQVGRVRDRHWVHDPWGWNALATLSGGAWALLQAADGRPAGVVAADVAQGDAARAERLLAELPLLLRHGFVRAPGIEPARPPQGERVFNAWLHLTNACNLACPYCYIHKDTRHLDAGTAARVLAAVEATARSGNVDRVHVRFAGGEPMLRFAELRRFYDDATAACARHGVRFSAAVLTNGTVLPAGAAQWLREHDISVSVSIDGVGDAQDVMRPVKGGGSSYSRLLAGLDGYLAAGIRPYMLITVGDSNLASLPDLTTFLLERRLGFRYSLVRDLEWGAGLLEDRQGAAEAAGGGAPTAESTHGAATGVLSGEPLRRVQRTFGQCYDLIEAAVSAAGLRGESVALPSFRRTHKFCDLELARPVAKACGAGETYVAISDTGEVSPCQAALHHPGTRPIDETSLLVQARGQTQLGTFRRMVGNPECNRCPHEPSCAGGCPLLLYRREGHVDGRSPYCDVFRAVIPRILRISALELLLESEAAARQGRGPVEAA